MAFSASSLSTNLAKPYPFERLSSPCSVTMKAFLIGPTDDRRVLRESEVYFGGSEEIMRVVADSLESYHEKASVWYRTCRTRCLAWTHSLEAPAPPLLDEATWSAFFSLLGGAIAALDCSLQFLAK